jgi:glycolate oxidase FAD binding subunit
MAPALQHLTEQILAASAQASPLCIRGGGSKDFYGQPPHGALLDTRPLHGILSYEPSELFVRAQAGTPLAEVETLLAEKNQCLPFEPPHFNRGHASVATVGGMVAAGLSGPARASVGGVRDYVLGLSLLNGRGEHLSFGGQVMKNVAGYDVSRLLVGSLGILGVVTEVSLKVLPLPAAEATLRFDVDEAQALVLLNRWAAQPLPINASCWLDGVLWLRLRGAQAAVMAAQKSLGGQPVDGAADFWQALREQTLPFFALKDGQALWRVAVPDTAPPLGLGPTLLEWGGAQRWLKISADSAQKVQEASAKHGGYATLFVAQEKSVARFAPLPPVLARIHRELKKQFDPAGIFNRGRLYPDL